MAITQEIIWHRGPQALAALLTRMPIVPSLTAAINAP
jgi:hypothetical protein